MTRYYIHVLICKSLINFIVTFFVIATKKVTERHPERMRRISIWRTLQKKRCFADAQHDVQTRSLRAFCLASAIRFVSRRNPLRSLSLCDLCVKNININK